MNSTATHQDHYEDLLAAYALGALDGEDHRELEAHLAAGCDRCEDLLQEWNADLVGLAESLPSVEPSEVTRKRILRIPDEHRDSPSPSATPAPTPREAPAPRTRTVPWKAALAASLAALAVSLLALWNQAGLTDELSRSQAAEERLEAELERVRTGMALTQSEMTRTRADLERLLVSVQSLGAPEGRAFVLAGLEGAPDAGGASFIDPLTRRAAFYAYGLPKPPAGKTYQLWWIAGGTPVSGGVFEVDESGRASLEVDQVPVGDVDVWAVTVEPEGGVPQPTGDPVLASQTA